MRKLTAAMLPALLVVLLTALPSGPAQAGKKFYKWQDEQGVWHYDETKPKDREAAPITVSQASPSSTNNAPVSSAPIPASTSANAGQNATSQSQIAETDEEAEAKVRANRKLACDRATEAVKIYESYARVSIDSDNDGKQETLNAEQQIARLKEARNAVNEYCN